MTDNDHPDVLHKPVLLAESVRALNPVAGGKYLDGTLGLGGHTRAILDAASDTSVLGIDRDCETMELARKRLAPYGSRVHFYHGLFANFSRAIGELGWRQLDGAILDLGVSSLQLDNPERGFSFRGDARLDMRMDRSETGKNAWDLVNRASVEELKNCFAMLGEEPKAAAIARNIIRERAMASIDTTARLADIISKSYPARWRATARNHPATRAFQALRMAVNGEIEQLRQFLAEIMGYLAPGARLVVISFHSIEDRLVKQAMRGWSRESAAYPRPIGKLLFKKPVVASSGEIMANPRARSAKLRAIEKYGLEES